MKKIYFLLSVAALILFTGCAKDEPRKGCMDATATNYDPDAVEDCCCKYSGKVVFFYNQTTSQRLQQQASYQLIFNIDNQKVGSYPSSRYWNGTPACGVPDNIEITREWEGGKSKTFSYLVFDEVGNTIWSGTQEWKAGACTPVLLK